MVIARLNEDIRKKFAPGADLVPEEMERTLVLVHSKSNGKPAAKPLLFTRASNLHGPVLHPAALRAKETDPAALRTKLVDLVTELVGKGVDVSKRRLTREYAIGLGSRREVEELIKDALDSGELVEGDRGNGGGKLIGPGVSR